MCKVGNFAMSPQFVVNLRPKIVLVVDYFLRPSMIDYRNIRAKNSSV